MAAFPPFASSFCPSRNTCPVGEVCRSHTSIDPTVVKAPAMKSVSIIPHRYSV